MNCTEVLHKTVLLKVVAAQLASNKSGSEAKILHAKFLNKLIFGRVTEL